jgi:hypothetical protein
MRWLAARASLLKASIHSRLEPRHDEKGGGCIQGRDLGVVPKQAMVGRNNLVAYDPAVARQAAQTELRSKVVPKVLDCNKPGTAPIELSAEARERQRQAVAMEMEKIKRRLDERRRRDPTFKETAIDLDRSKMLPFSKFRDYYAVRAGCHALAFLRAATASGNPSSAPSPMLPCAHL